MAPTERIFPAVPAVFGGGRVLPSPSQFYLTGEDRLRIVSANSLTGVRLKLQVRTARIDGNIQAQSFDHIPNTDRTVATQDYPIGDGSVLNVTVFAGNGTPKIGQTYVMVQLVRGVGAAAIVLGTLLGGYVTNTQALGFPGSPIENSLAGTPAIRYVVGTTPAVGASYNEVVPTGARWRLLSFQAFLNTSAAAGTRQANLQISSPAGRIINSPQVHTVGPSTGVAFFWLPGLPVIADFTPSGPGIAGLPTPCDLSAGCTISDLGTGIGGGDAWSAPVYAVQEYLDF